MQCWGQLDMVLIVCAMHAGGMTEFRRSLVASFMFRMFASTAVMLEQQGAFVLEDGSFPHSMRSAAVKAHRDPASGIQYFSKAQDGATVGRPERHMAADLQVHPTLHATVMSAGRTACAAQQ